MRRTPRRAREGIRRSKERGASRADRTTHAVAPRQVFTAVAERSPLALRRAPHRARELEVRLTGALGTLDRRDPGAAKREVHMTERESRDVREAAFVSGDEPAAFSLDRVRAGL